jgi:hypothetical protein
MTLIEKASMPAAGLRQIYTRKLVAFSAAIATALTKQDDLYMLQLVSAAFGEGDNRWKLPSS